MNNFFFLVFVVVSEKQSLILNLFLIIKLTEEGFICTEKKFFLSVFIPRLNIYYLYTMHFLKYMLKFKHSNKLTSARKIIPQVPAFCCNNTHEE